MSAFGLVLALIVIAVVVAAFYRQYANWRMAPWYSTLTVTLTWFLSMSIVVLIPMDISATYYHHCLDEHTPRPNASASAFPSASSSASSFAPTFTSDLGSATPSASSFAETTLDGLSPSDSLLFTATASILEPAATATSEALVTFLTSLSDAAPTPSSTGFVPASGQADQVVDPTMFCEQPWTYVSPDVFPVIWKIVYWTSQLLTWIILPFMQSYVDAGDFTFWGKLKTSIRENLIVYGSLGVLVVGLFLYIAIKASLSVDALLGIAMAASNTWGLFLLIGLLGVGLVETPRSTWNESRADWVTRHLQFKASKLRTELDDAEDDLSETLTDVKAVTQKINFTHHLRPYVDEILFKCPTNAADDLANRPNKHSRSTASESRLEGLTDITLSSLAKLHRRVIRRSLAVRRTQALYERCMDEALEFEEMVEQKDIAWTHFQSNLSSSYSGPFKKFVHKFTFLWRFRLRRLLFAFAAFVFLFFSLAIIWSECSFFKTDPTLSLYAIIMNSAGTSYQYTNVEVFSFISLTYMAICAYAVIFRIRFFNFYYLAKHQQTDDSSLLFSALFLSRLTAPLCLNFLSMSHLDGHVVSTISQETAFTQIMGHMDVVGFIQDGFNVYFPIFIVLIAVLAWFHACGRFLSCIGMSRFLDNDDLANDAIVEGRELIRRERRLRERAQNPGAASHNSLPAIRARGDDSMSRSSSNAASTSVIVDPTADAAGSGGLWSSFSSRFRSAPSNASAPSIAVHDAPPVSSTTGSTYTRASRGAGSSVYGFSLGASATSSSNNVNEDSWRASDRRPLNTGRDDHVIGLDFDVGQSGSFTSGLPSSARGSSRGGGRANTNIFDDF
ncbi:hypothetical protein CAOG_00345 [Capsaspora owczarzaki ATCC 30864]|uniref:LMBR1 domain-containing protein 2 n=1 Tax=Capsaspora owczarzaki (strain ATCC 30864) TaxID=595528 RepID=A0A0D2WGY0_CAPO3|nr:hypothetical protein CAOG_00345 [Capsaspora owczarzaki ATCC 30864]KJE88755.1 hypothetical protein CAOG_000345 [Capsaspora owczarzaki ATCC 30864]|eukprot:XP_004365216.1 hypothetical protein CAOG_00345 [Capsaspora owczarzaki ATCC 30864]